MVCQSYRTELGQLVMVQRTVTVETPDSSEYDSEEAFGRSVDFIPVNTASVFVFATFENHEG